MIIPNRFLRGPILPRVQSSNVTLGFVLQRKEGVNVTSPREKFRSVLAGKVPILAANIFDPLSARIAQILEYEVYVLSGSVAKGSALNMPDLVLTNISDLVAHAQRIIQTTKVPLMVDAEDGFGGPVNVVRTIADLENTGVAAIEIEDNFVPKSFGVSRPGVIPTDMHVAKLQAAISTRSDPTLTIVARTAALGECPLDEALHRITAYSETGVDAIMLASVPRGQKDIEAVHSITDLPLCILNSEISIREHRDFLIHNNVKILMLGNPTYAATVQTIYDVLLRLREGDTFHSLAERLASRDLLQRVIHTDEYIALQELYSKQKTIDGDTKDHAGS